MVDVASWKELAARCFPEIHAAICCDAEMLCDELADMTDAAHRRGDTDFLRRSYGFIRWSMRYTDDARLRSAVAHWFFDRILQLESSKKACVDFLDWGDVKAFMDAWGCEPSFKDEENFGALIEVWTKRWGRNQKLPDPMLPPVVLEVPPEYADYVDHPMYGKGPRFTGWDPVEDNYTAMLCWIRPPESRIPGTAIRADPDRQNHAGFPYGIYYDLKRICEDCARPFIFFAEEQRFWFEVLRFNVNADCIRCPPCRELHRKKRKKKRDAG
ncbi:zinc-ribbon domain containing protein [Luteolibacter sp. SL250]|uniref:zinc-ribbon domain containing protein n=1 Tax=Luteolibacter sp. SL250 TaxID=2995170 RepID=UPI00226F2B9C|nr:zinc-ribbon domain containing protein [Luteolibacter sp. SL250]WAC21504.1 zinc-ribbon domain containing protein [Luteolibacter sp. SL250]